MAPMNMRPITPPQSVANCWIEVETNASGGEKAVTRPLSARNGHRCSRRQANVDAQAAERRLLQAQLAVVQRDLLGDDRQAEPGARGGGGRSASERLEQALALGHRDARAVVLDADDQRAALALEADAHRSARAPVEGSVVEQVVDQQPQAAAPAVD